MVSNLFDNLPIYPETEESLTTLLARPGLRLERIVSTGQASPPDFWYEQPDAEWVLVLAGEAHLRLAGVDKPLRMSAGDWIFIEAGQRHRIDWTSPVFPTVWLALHWSPLSSD